MRHVSRRCAELQPFTCLAPGVLPSSAAAMLSLQTPRNLSNPARTQTCCARDVLWVRNGFFMEVIQYGFDSMLGDLGLKFLPDERAMAFEVFEMDLFIVADAVLPKPPEELEPAFAQAAQGAGMVMALRTLGLVISLRPSALFAAGVGPQMHGVAQKVI